MPAGTTMPPAAATSAASLLIIAMAPLAERVMRLLPAVLALITSGNEHILSVQVIEIT